MGPFMPKLEIDPHTWVELNQLLDSALDQPAAQRAEWIERLAPRYDALKPRLRDLLSRSGPLDDSAVLGTLPRFALDTDDSEAADAIGDRPGDQVGPYRLLRELGQGGMGTVWLAERSDGLIERPVALKLPHGASERAGLALRMARERRILASLTHPNIARLYDAGLTPEGRPFLALEYIEGRQIDGYCRERQLDLKSRLRLFAQVAHGVAHAHAKLVVHRDLKPANVLVTSDGQVRLLDFGIAKLLDEGEAKETQLTELAGRALTPAYASPEQILGDPPTIASDVYSLGVILYELLTGQRPYRPKRDSRGALEDAIVHEEPSPPSEVADRQSRTALRGDLDAIMLTALKKKPEERYSTVHALVDDIERYLSARPVLAQPDRIWYRASKFIARNTIAVGAAAAVFAATVIGAGVAGWQARVAVAEKARAEQVKEFIASVFREADPTQGKGNVLSGAELLRQAELRLNDRTDADLQMRVELLAIIGESLFGLQENADSARVLEHGLRLHESLGVPSDPLSARLHLVLSQVYEILGRHDDAQREIERSLSVLKASDDNASPVFIHAKLQQAALGIVFGDYKVAEQAALDGISTASSTLGPKSSEVATGLQMLSHVYTLTQRREQAVEPARQSYDLLLAIHAGNVTHPKVIESTLYYAQALNTAGDFDRASTLYKDVAAKTASVFGADSRSFGEALSAGLPLDIEVGDLKAAIASGHRAIEIYLKEGQPGSATHAGRVRKLGSALLAARSGREAAEQLGEAVRLAVAAKSDLEAVHARGSLGLALAYLGRFDEADRHLREAIEKSEGKSPRAHHLASRNLGTSLRLQGRFAEALPWLEKSIKESALQPSHRGDHAHGLLETGLTHLELGEFDTARSLLDRASVLFADVQRQRVTPARADLLVGFARVDLQRGNNERALQSAQEADRFWRGFDAENPSSGSAALWLGRCHLALGQQAAANEALGRAARLLSRSPIPSDVRLRELVRRR
jgi:serine/threonine-protein kinase